MSRFRDFIPVAKVLVMPEELFRQRWMESGVPKLLPKTFSFDQRRVIDLSFLPFSLFLLTNDFFLGLMMLIEANPVDFKPVWQIFQGFRNND